MDDGAYLVSTPSPPLLHSLHRSAIVRFDFWPTVVYQQRTIYSGVCDLAVSVEMTLITSLIYGMFSVVHTTGNRMLEYTNLVLIAFFLVLVMFSSLT